MLTSRVCTLATHGGGGISVCMMIAPSRYRQALALAVLFSRISSPMTSTTVLSAFDATSSTYRHAESPEARQSGGLGGLPGGNGGLGGGFGGLGGVLGGVLGGGGPGGLGGVLGGGGSGYEPK